MQYTRQPLLLYHDISQKSPLFVRGAVVGESPPWAGRSVYTNPQSNKVRYRCFLIDFTATLYFFWGRGAEYWLFELTPANQLIWIL
jgi:hypothetical protein